MYDAKTISAALEALGRGLSTRKAAREVGVSPSTIVNWSKGRLPRPRKAPERAIIAPVGKGTGNGGTMPLASESEKRLYKPPRSGPLAGLEPTQIENLLLRAVLDDLKAGESDLASISNRSKVELGERLRLATGLPLRSITSFLRISKSSYEYHRARLGRDKYAEVRAEVRSLFEEGGGNWGYRTIWARLRRGGTAVSEKVVRRLMREEGLRVVYLKSREKGWSSYEGEVSKAPDNLVNRDFTADAPDKLWLTDITEFKLPSKEKVYLSPVVDCFDGKPVSWSIGTSPNAELANSSLRGAVSQMSPGSAPIVHSDRGGHYRWPAWIDICDKNGLVRSMSKKACSPDNSAMEGFFGRLKNEFFYYRDWEGVGVGEFTARLDAYLEYYCEGRIKKSLGWMSPNEYRRMRGYAP